MKRSITTQSKLIFVICAILLAVVLALALSSGSPPAAAQDSGETTELPPEYAAQIPQEIKDQIRYFGGGAMLRVAKSMGVNAVEGKSIDVNDDSQAAYPAWFRNVGIGVHPTKHENEPAVAANPINRENLVAGSHFFGPPAPTANRCVAYTSSNYGANWSAPFAMPHLNPLSQCSDPVLAYAPDGSRVYYAYMDIKTIFNPAPPVTFTIDLDIVVSYSDNNGATWTGPIIALNGLPTIITFAPLSFTPGFQYDKCWIGTHNTVAQDQSNWVYVTATRFDDFSPFGIHIAFTRSGNKAAVSSWSAPTLLESGRGLAPVVVVQGSRPTGGEGGQVLVAWYSSGTDGWLSGSFRIRTRRSGNNGATFDPAVNAAVDSFELPFWLGPFAFYHRWWGAMFPDVEISPGGAAHIAYTHDPVAGSSNAEDGNIRYVTSSGPPYTSWSAPVTINDDGLVRAQGYVALAPHHGGNALQLHAIWEDHRTSPNLPIAFPNSPNLFFDIFHSLMVPNSGVGWSPNVRISSATSINDFIFIGDYNDLTSSNYPYAVWTDRRHRTSILQFEDNVFGGPVITFGGP